VTKNEDYDRAAKIWGPRVKVFGKSLPPVSWGQANTLGLTEWEVSLGPRTPLHSLDQNGHPTCHDKCKRIEEKL